MHPLYAAYTDTMLSVALGITVSLLCVLAVVAAVVWTCVYLQGSR